MTTIDRLPWFRFYPADWRGDVNLRACTLSARGLWIECLGIMHEATPRGWLIVGGVPVLVDALALHVGRPVKEVRAALGELERAGVSSTGADGALFSRRMARDTGTAEAASVNGAQGGRPRKAKPKAKPKLTESEIVHPAGSSFDEPLSTEDLGFGFDLGVSEGSDPPPPLDLATPPPAFSPPPASIPADLPALFALFWAAYPRHSGKKAAAAAFAKIGADAALVDTLIAAVEAQRGGRQWREGFIPHAATWLHGERWADEIEAPSTRPSTRQVPPQLPDQVGGWRDRCRHVPPCDTPTLCALRGPA